MAKVQIHELIERAAEWPEDAQQELVQSMADIEARYFGVYVTNSDERAALNRSHDDMKNDRFATNTDIEKVFHHFHRA